WSSSVISTVSPRTLIFFLFLLLLLRLQHQRDAHLRAQSLREYQRDMPPLLCFCFLLQIFGRLVDSLVQYEHGDEGG
ncbi:hypothetical protein PFISCL1PPCAC_26456, partial [Pristionchus fissidentatus]